MARRQGSPKDVVIALLTDFGTADGYVGAMKGVILGLNPRACLVDVTHEIPPQDVRGGAFVLHTVHRYFPARTVLLVVVDPGVGTERAAVILDTGPALFVAPDNGLLSFVLAEAKALSPESRVLEAGARKLKTQNPALGTQHSGPSTQDPALRTQNPELSAPLPPGWRAVRIAEPRFWLPNPSTTFHGRDIFAPVAAHLSLGEPVEGFGPAMDTLKAFLVPTPRLLPDGQVEGEVLHVDRFGNLITNLRAEDLPRGEMVVEVAGHRIRGLRPTYAGGVGLVALVGSSGYLEIALPGGSARAEIGQGVGMLVRVMGME